MLLTIAASATSTALFNIEVVTLRTTLTGHSVAVDFSTHTLPAIWLACACSLVATHFWLSSACCCSVENNPHHHSSRRGELGVGATATI